MRLVRIILRSDALNSSSLSPSAPSIPICLSSFLSMKVKTVKVMRPMKRRAVQNPTGPDTPPILSARIGDIEKMANTPIRAIAISRPMARAISLPLNHLAIALDTVVPAISHPQPKIMNPKDANLAEAGMDVHHESSHVANDEPAKASLMA